MKSKILKFLFVGTLSLVLVLSVAHLVYKYSGSNEWELIRDENGIQMYSMKSPGTVLKRFKANKTVKASMSSFVALMQDADACAQYCLDGKIIDKANPQMLYFIYTSGMPFPFKTREKVFMGNFNVNPETKELFLEFVATPNKIPRNDCCVRVLHKYSTWRVTPKGNGELDIEFIIDEDLGGSFPHYLINQTFPFYTFILLSDLENILNQEKYQNAKFDFVTEL